MPATNWRDEARALLARSPQDETAFREWYSGHARQQGLDQDPDAPAHFYDYRAAYRAGAGPDTAGHWPSAFKRDGHPNLIVDGLDTRTGRPPVSWREEAARVLAAPAPHPQPSSTTMRPPTWRDRAMDMLSSVPVLGPYLRRQADPAASFADKQLPILAARGLGSAASSTLVGAPGGLLQATGNAMASGDTGFAGYKSAGASLSRLGGALSELDATAQESLRPPSDLSRDIAEQPDLMLDPAWWAYHGGQLTGSIASFLVPAGVGARAGARGADLASQLMTVSPAFRSGMAAAGATAGASGVEALVEAGSAFNDAKSRGLSDDEAGTVAAKVFSGNMALLSATNAFAYFTPALRPAWAQLLRGAATEGAQEVGQEAIPQMARGETPTLSGTAAVLGALGGGAQAGASRSTLPAGPSIEDLRAERRARQSAEGTTPPPNGPKAEQPLPPAAQPTAPAPLPIAPPSALSAQAAPTPQPSVDSPAYRALANRLRGQAEPQIVPFPVPPRGSFAAYAQRDAEMQADWRAEARAVIEAGSAPSDLSVHQRRELRRMAAELDAMPFTPRTFTPVDPNRRDKGNSGAGFDITAGAAGAEVYHQVLGHWGRKGTRADVRKAIDTVLAGKKSAWRTQLVETADARLRGTLKPQLPAHMGDEPGQIYVDRLTDDRLTEDDRRIQEDAATRLEQDPAGFMARYRERFGNFVSADDAKELFEEYAATVDTKSARTLAVHRPSSALARAVYEQLVQEPTPEGKADVVLFTAGGTGSGKTSSVRHLLEPVVRNAHLVYDSTLASLEGAQRDIETAKHAGKGVIIAYTYRPADVAYRDGVLPRAQREGRIVDVRSHVATHVRALANVRRLAERYAGDPDVEFIAIDNSREAPAQARFVSLGDLEGVQYDLNDVRRQTADVLEAARAAGAIDRRVYEASKEPARAEDGERNQGRARQPQSRGQEGPPAAGDGSPGVSEPRPDVLSELLKSGRRKPAPPVPSNPGTPSTAAPLPLPVATDRTLDPTSGSLTRRPFFGPPAGSTARPALPLKRSAVVRELGRLFNLPIKTGRFRERAFGVYKTQPQVSRLKVENDLATLAHELGHHIDYALLKHRPVGLFADELKALGKATAGDNAGPALQIAEGVAEFFRTYIPDPVRAKAVAPNYYAALEEALAQDADLRGQLQRAQTIVQQFLAQDLATRGDTLDFGGSNSAFAKAIEAIRPDDDGRTVVDKLARVAIDDLADVDRVTKILGADGLADYRKNAYVLARLARGAAGKAEGFLEFGVRDADGRKVAASFKDAIAPVRHRLRDFSRYLVARHVPERLDAGKETGITRDEAAAIVATLDSPEFRQAAENVYRYKDALLDFAVESGVLTANARAKFRETYTQHVPLFRVGKERKGGRRRGSATRSMFKRATGSGADIIDPLEGIIRHTHEMIAGAADLRYLRALVDHATTTVGGGRFLEEIPAKMLPTRLKVGDVLQVLRQSDAVQSLEDFGDVDAEHTLTFWKPQAIEFGNDRVLVVPDREGRPHVYSINDDALAETLNTQGPKAAHIAVRALAPFSRALRAGATLTLGFVARNPLRDTATAAVQSKHGFKPGLDTARGVFHVLRKTELYRDWLDAGGSGANLVAGDRNAVQRELRRLTRPSWREIVTHVPASPTELMRALWAHRPRPIDALRTVSGITENATRVGEHARARATHASRGDVRERAALASRDVTVDFSRAGTMGREINQVAAFFNAQVQGYARMAASAKTDPVGFATRGFAYISLPTIALWAINKDDEEYRNLPWWRRSLFWNIPVGTGPRHGWIPIPKPFELGLIFGTGVELALDFITERDPHAYKRLLVDDPDTPLDEIPVAAAKGLAWGLFDTVAVNAFAGIYEVSMNYDLFRERHIVPPWDEDLPEAEQYTKYTSESAKLIGRWLNYSPAKIDHLVNAYGAGLATGTVKNVERVAGMLGLLQKPELQKPVETREIPLLSSFYTPAPSTNAQALRDFYARFDRLNDVAKVIRRAEAEDDAAKVADYRAKYPTLRRDLAGLREAHALLKQKRGALKALEKRRDLALEQKQQKEERIVVDMINIAAKALGQRTIPAPLPLPLAGAAR